MATEFGTHKMNEAKTGDRSLGRAFLVLLCANKEVQNSPNKESVPFETLR